jgi:hypothetical protein
VVTAYEKRLKGTGKRGFLLFLLLSLPPLFLLLGYWLYKAREIAQAMIAKGWGEYLGVKDLNAFLLQCLLRSECGRTLENLLSLPDSVIYLYGAYVVLVAFFTLRPRVVKIPLRYGQHWATPEEIAPLVETRTPEQIIDSGLPERVEKEGRKLMGYLGVYELPQKSSKKSLFLRVPESVERVHSITYAGTGGGKTVGIFRPRLALDAAEGNIAVVLDTKYPNPNDSYLDTRTWFRAFGRQITVIDPFGKEETVQIPVLEGVRSFTDALDVARYIYPPGIEDVDPASRVFVANARSLMAGILYGLAADGREPVSFAAISDVANSSVDAMLAWFNSHPDAKAAIQAVLAADKYVLTGAMNRLVLDLEIFRLPSANLLFSPGERAVDMEKLLTTPGMIHIVLPESELRGSSGKAILRFFKRYFDRAMLKLVETLEKPLPIHVNFYYDEFALFGFLPDFAADLATFRSRNISVHMATQSRAQVVDIYGESGWRAIENNNIGVFYLIPGSYTHEEAAYWSKMLGKQSFLGASVSESVEPERASVTEGERERELATPDELMRMGQGEIVALVRRFPPIRLKTYPVDDERSPVHWVWVRAQEFLAQDIANLLKEPLTPPYAQPITRVEEAYRALRAALSDGAKRGKAPVYVTPWEGGNVLLIQSFLEEVGVTEENIEKLVEYGFLLKTPRGVAIGPSCPLGEGEIQDFLSSLGRERLQGLL